MSELSAAIRFLAAFTAIENHFRWKLQDQTSGFVKMAETYAKRYGISLGLRALRTFAELRNALVHNDFYDGKPIADPVPEVVERIESLRDKIVSPPTVLSVIPHAVTSFGPDDPLSSVLEEIRNHNYSQFPIYEDDQFRGLLTTNCIARWLAKGLSTVGLVETERVRAVLKFKESQDEAVHLSRKTTVPQAIKKLSPASDGSLPPAAFIITAGKRNERPLSIVVATIGNPDRIDRRRRLTQLAIAFARVTDRVLIRSEQHIIPCPSAYGSCVGAVLDRWYVRKDAVQLATSLLDASCARLRAAPINALEADPAGGRPAVDPHSAVCWPISRRRRW